jgi:hypothetical protein
MPYKHYLSSSLLFLLAFSTFAGEPSQTVRFVAPDRSYSFNYPRSWSVEHIAQINGFILMAPSQEANWRANLFFEVRVDSESRTIEKAVNDLIPILRSRKSDFKLVRVSDIKLQSGRVAKRIEFTHSKNGVALTEWEILVPMNNNKILFILAATVTRLKEKYQPSFTSGNL